jgi:putative heme-binding domain-containing protein
LDWTYGTLYAVHLTPRGASYWGEKEAFITGKPLPLTDAVVHPDGNLYFAIGGRGNQSALYRVRYTGQESTAPAAPRPLKKQCQWRRELEAAMETPPGPENVEKAWKLLGNEDRFLRFAARTLLEKQPVALWSEKAIQERETIPSALDALCALARMGDKSMQPRILSALQWVQSQDLRESEALDMLRVYSLCFLRMGAPSDEVKASLAEKFEPMFPSPSDALNKEVAEMLVYLGSKKVVPVALQTMLSGQEDAHADSGDPSLLKLNDRYAADIKAAQKSRPNRPQIALAYALQYATAGWTPELRRTYFRWFNSALKWQGGNSFTGFLENMRKQALTNVPSEMQEELKAIKAEMLATPQDLPRATGPGKFYTVEDLEALATPEKLKNRDLANGKKMYQAALCASCHRFGQEYSGVGPDLTGIANRYSIKDLAENIINPSKVISDQYESTQIDKIDGTALVGRILSEDGKTVKVAENPLLPESLTEVPVDQIKAKSRYPLSAMPAGLLASLNESEVLDLMAFLLSGGQ